MANDLSESAPHNQNGKSKGSESQTRLPDSITAAFCQAYDCSTLDQAIVAACSKLRKRVEETEPPFSLKKLLAACEARLVKTPIATEGRLEWRNNGFTVAANPHSNWRRQRFTIAHEIAHILLIEALASHASCLRLLKEPGAWKAVEHFCDSTAAELLMPIDDVISSLDTFGFSEDGLGRIYDRYLTSYAAIFVRLKQVVRGSSVILWRSYARHEQERVTLRVMKCYHSNKGPWLPEGITARYVDPDIVSMAVQERKSYHASLKMKTQAYDRCMGIATVAPKVRREQTQLPILDGATVPDETRLGFEAALFLLSVRDCEETQQIWTQLSRHSLPFG